MKKLNLMDLVDGRSVYSKEGLLSRNSVFIYKYLNPNNMMKESSRKMFALKKEAIIAIVMDEVTKVSKRKVAGYQYSSAKTWESYQELIKSIPHAPGKMIIVGMKGEKMFNERSLIISSDFDLRDKVSNFFNMHDASLFQHLVGNLNTGLFDSFLLIRLTETK